MQHFDYLKFFPKLKKFQKKSNVYSLGKTLTPHFFFAFQIMRKKSNLDKCYSEQKSIKFSKRKVADVHFSQKIL